MRVWAVLEGWASRLVSAQCLSGTLAVALLTLACYRLHLNFSTVSFLYLIVVVLLSSKGGFFSSAFVSIIALGCLDYFFVPPIFSLRVVDRFNVVAITVFLATSLVITRLVTKLRKMNLWCRGSQGDLASVQAVTLVNAEQASKRLMQEPTRPGFGEGRSWWNRTSEQIPSDLPGYWRGHAGKVDHAQHGKSQR